MDANVEYCKKSSVFAIGDNQHIKKYMIQQFIIKLELKIDSHIDMAKVLINKM